MTTNLTHRTSPVEEYERLTAEIAALEIRLEKGMELYHATVNAEQRQRYYDKWLPILREYERKYQERRNLGYVPEGAE
jgi:hypothetical protein